MARNLGLAGLVTLLGVSQGYKQGLGCVASPSGELSREESTPKLVQVVGRIHFLMAVSLRVPATY